MFAYLKIALMAVLCLLALALSAEASTGGGRKLLDEWNDCNSGWNNWRNGGYHGDYYCGGHRWDHNGGYYGGDGRYYGPGDRGGFCIGICG